MWLEDYGIVESRENVVREAILNENYFKWLIINSIENPVFFVDDPIKNILSKEKNLIYKQKLGVLYNAIAKYADSKGIYPLQCNYCIYYKIKIGHVGFDIGMLRFGESSTFFCNKEDIVDENAYINYRDFLDFYKENGLARKQ